MGRVAFGKIETVTPSVQSWSFLICISELVRSRLALENWGAIPQDMLQPNTIHQQEYGASRSGRREKVFQVVFESETVAGRLFDKVLIVAIVSSILAVMIDSMPQFHIRWAKELAAFEWFFTLLFTVEYLLRVSCLRRPARYAFSFYGVIDLLAVLPFYLALIFPGIRFLADVRVIRLLRIFRIFKLTAYIQEFGVLRRTLMSSARKIVVFLTAVLMIVIVMGSLMYVIEGPSHGFTSIPTSVYWAITTMTTVGYGDISPQTEFGRLLSSMMMLIGWGTLAVPTGIITSELIMHRPRGAARMESDADTDAAQDRFCPHCGGELAHTSSMDAAEKSGAEG